jgi:hypothetical protein
MNPEYVNLYLKNNFPINTKKIWAKFLRNASRKPLSVNLSAGNIQLFVLPDPTGGINGSV